MNKDNLFEIFSRYIDKFDHINNANCDENYKWLVCKKFKACMDDALSKDGEAFVTALSKARAVTENIIDSYTQPFAGLIEFAKHEPQTVKEMFLSLYANDGGDIHVQEALIEKFFNKSNELLDKYSPNSFRFKQNSHSVSAYLFLYAPETHYMFKAAQANIFADCIEYYEDWGTGDNINLAVYYRMCDWLVEQIFNCEELLKTDASRFKLPIANQMYEDKNKHLLAFDIIYTCSVYDLFDGISFIRPNLKEKNLILEKKSTALRLLEEYNTALEKAENLNRALRAIEENFTPNVLLTHKKFGVGKWISYSQEIAEVEFAAPIGNKKLGVYQIFSTGLVKLDDADMQASLMQHIPYLKDKEMTINAVALIAKELAPYQEYLE